MKPLRSTDWKSAFGFMAAVALLALSTPGVQVVRAEDAGAEVIAAGQTCEASADAGPSVTADLLMEQLRRAQTESDPSEDGPIVLNNRGYNYGPPPSIDPTMYKRTASHP